MKILIVSDTHNNIDMLRKVLKKEKPEILIHLGDYYEDSLLAEYSQYCSSLYRVPGIFHPGYKDKSLAHIEKMNLKEFKIIFVHNLDDLTLADYENTIILYGHSHIQNIQMLDSNILINPGHLKLLIDRNQPASYLLVYAEENLLKLESHLVEGGLRHRYIIYLTKDKKLELKYD